MRDVLRGFGTGFTIAAAILLFLLAALFAGGLAYEAWTWTSSREHMGWPIAIFAFNATCLACCAFTRYTLLRVACVLGLGGGLVLLFVVAGIWFQY